MGNDLFGVDIAAILYEATAGELRPGTLTKRTPGTRTTGALSGGMNPTTSDYPCEGYVELGTSKRFDDQISRFGNFVSIIGGSLLGAAVPAVDDYVTMDGRTFMILEMYVDPALALYVLRVES